MGDRLLFFAAQFRLANLTSFRLVPEAQQHTVTRRQSQIEQQRRKSLNRACPELAEALRMTLS